MFGFRKKKQAMPAAEAEKQEKQAGIKTGTIDLFAPADGELIALESVSDPVFSQKMMGDGFAVVPQGHTIVSPIEGKVVLCAPTAHAIGLESQGVSLLVHCGFDTVNLNGEGLQLQVQEGDSVKAGDPLLVFDEKMMQAKGIDMTTPVVITEPGEFVLELVAPGPVHARDVIGHLKNSQD